MRSPIFPPLRCFLLILGCALPGGCEPPPEPPHPDVDVDIEEDVELPCGGLLGTLCPEGLECVDDPSDGCDPHDGGADCIGVCKAPGEGECGGQDGALCPAGEACVDDPADDCDPAKGDADCPGVCQGGEAPILCSELSDETCPEDTVCVDEPGDGCEPGGEDDCPGTCRAPTSILPEVTTVAAPLPPPLSPCESPARAYVSRDAQACTDLSVLCQQGYALFNDGCGCGCVALPSGPETPPSFGAIAAPD